MLKKIVIFGAGKISYAITNYIAAWEEYEVCGYIVDKQFINDSKYLGKPLVDLNEAVKHFPPSEFDAFVAIGYQSLNSSRSEKVTALSAFGYKVVNIVNPLSPTDLKMGGNCFIGSGEQIQPGVICGDNVFIWSGALVGHHTKLCDNCWITGGAAIGGSVKIGVNSFIGIGATVGHEVDIGNDCIIGAGTLVTKNIQDGTVVIREETKKYRLDSAQFIRFSNCFKS